MGQVRPGVNGSKNGKRAERILIVEELSLLADVVKHALETRGYQAHIGTDLTTQGVLNEFEEVGANLVIVDAGISFGNPVELVARLSQMGSPVLMLMEQTAEATVADCIDAGATGFVSKHGSVDDLMRRVETALAGDRVLTLEQRYRLEDARRASNGHAARLEPFEGLSRREQDVLASLSKGHTAAAIADDHFVALSTVRSQIRSILSKLDVHSQVSAVALAMETGWTNRAESELSAQRETGATMVEYALMVGLIAIVVAVAVGVFGIGVDAMFDQASDCVGDINAC